MNIDFKMVVSVMVGVLLANLVEPTIRSFFPQG